MLLNLNFSGQVRLFGEIYRCEGLDGLKSDLQAAVTEAINEVLLGYAELEFMSYEVEVDDGE